jgi:hypothetical protein
MPENGLCSLPNGRKRIALPERADDRIHPSHDHPQSITHFVVVNSLTHKAVHLILLTLKSNVLSTRMAMGVKSEEISKRLDSDGREELE